VLHEVLRLLRCGGAVGWTAWVRAGVRLKLQIVLNEFGQYLFREQRPELAVEVASYLFLLSVFVWEKCRHGYDIIVYEHYLDTKKFKLHNLLEIFA